VEVSLPTDSIEASLSPEFERQPLERDERVRIGAVLERIGRHDATLWVPAGAHRLDPLRTARDEF
jgi:hypothetical protein